MALNTVTVMADQLRRLAKEVLINYGTPDEHAGPVADHLVEANLSGVDTHGVMMLPLYVEAISTGQLDPRASPEVLWESDVLATVQGHLGFGQVAALLATEMAVAKARASGLSAVALVESHHIGRLGDYVERAAAANTVLMIWGGGQGEELPQAVPYGGARAVLHTNPIAIGVPVEWGPPFVLDIATSTISGAKIWQARTRGEQLPSSAIVDRDGKPATDPQAFFEGGAHLPFGGHKGYGLMLAAELLGRVLTGADDFASPDHGSPVFRHSGNLFVAIRVDAFADSGRALQRAASLLDRVRGVAPAPGFTEVLAPGDPESRARSQRARDGIAIDEVVWQRLIHLAGTTPPQRPSLASA
jgi:LDH2 family malate/lactate/ureidoglycolate dehydrogenase